MFEITDILKQQWNKFVQHGGVSLLLIINFDIF